MAPAGPTRYLTHRDNQGDVDGIANFHLPWSSDVEHAGTLAVDTICALSPQAEHDLWRLLLDFDLTKTITAASRPKDDPLRWQLQNPRALRVSRLSDNLWIRLLDVPNALTRRSYDIDDALTIRLPADPMCPKNVGTWRLETRHGEASCTPTNDAPDLELDPQTLGSLYLGGLSASNLHAAGRVTAHTSDAVSRLSRLFRTDPEPHNSFGF